MAEAQPDGIISCGNCMEKEGYIINPLSLPCDHPMCEVCLSERTPDDAGKIECAVCKWVILPQKLYWWGDSFLGSR